jgi:hypothetical protein
VVALATAFILLWTASIFLVIKVSIPSGTVRLWFGAIDVIVAPSKGSSEFSIKFDGTPPRYVPSWEAVNGGSRIMFPLWLPAAVLCWPGYRALRRLRRVLPGHCPICRYDLQGNESGRCPECGTAVRPAG